jgi:hypothetical protein
MMIGSSFHAPGIVKLGESPAEPGVSSGEYKEILSSSLTATTTTAFISPVAFSPSLTGRIASVIKAFSFFAFVSFNNTISFRTWFDLTGRFNFYISASRRYLSIRLFLLFDFASFNNTLSFRLGFNLSG